MMSDMCTVIEFVGLPGAGKTSVAKELVNDTERESLKFRSKEDFECWKKNIGFSRIWISRLLTSLSLFKYFLVLKGYRVSSIKRMIRIFFDVADSGLYLSCEKPRFFLRDQLFIQDCWSLLVDGVHPDKEGFARLLDDISLLVGGKYVAVFFFIDHEIAAKRVDGRQGGTSRFDGLELSDIKAKLNAYGTYFDFLLEIVKVGELSKDVVVLNLMDGQDIGSVELARMLADSLLESHAK